jgi:hypothetical protein
MGLMAVTAQDTKKRPTIINAEEEEGPMVLKFEPDFVAASIKKRALFLEKRSMIDTMDISDRKRERLLKQLYQGKSPKELQGGAVADTKFEDAM